MIDCKDYSRMEMIDGSRREEGRIACVSADLQGQSVVLAHGVWCPIQDALIESVSCMRGGVHIAMKDGREFNFKR
jgi:hypothetical protein